MFTLVHRGYCAIIFILLAANSGSAAVETPLTPQVSLSSPMDFQVFQRQGARGGRVVIDGTVSTGARSAPVQYDRIEARLVGKSVAGDLPGAFQAIPFDNRVRRFRAELPAPAGGWYRLEMRLMGEGRTNVELVVEHVGIGEVFVVAGQSNSANHGDEKQKPGSPLVVAFGNGRWQPANDPQPGASGKGGSFLPSFGDAMAARFKVPIGLMAIGVGSTSVREWLPAGDVMSAPPTTGANTVFLGANTWVSEGTLYDRIVATENLLGTSGFRAVLWHQGESDNHQPPDREITPSQYRKYLERVIESSRVAAGWRAPWFVAQASYHTPDDPGSPELRAAQKSLATDGIALEGPNTDELGTEYRSNGGRGVHFSARGLQKHGALWAEKVAPWLERELAGKQ